MGEAADLGDQLLPVWCSQYLCFIDFDDGHVDQVAAICQRLQLQQVLGAERGNWWDRLATAAVLATALGESAAASRLLGAAAAECHDLPNPLPEGAYYARFEEEARCRLGDEAFAAEWAAGRQMSRAEFTAEIDRLLTVAGTTPPPRRHHLHSAPCSRPASTRSCSS